jgi:hypothetical protein
MRVVNTIIGRCGVRWLSLDISSENKLKSLIFLQNINTVVINVPVHFSSQIYNVTMRYDEYHTARINSDSYWLGLLNEVTRTRIKYNDVQSQ